MIQITVGSDTIKWQTIRDKYVPERCSFEKSRNQGTRNDTAGTIRIIKIMPEERCILALPMAYAAGKPSNIARNVEIRLMIRLLQIGLKKSYFPNTFK